MAGYVKTKHDCPFHEGVDVTDVKQGAVMDTSHKYRFVNVGSGMSLEVANSEAASGANVQQGNTGADGWTLADAGEGYYYIYSELGDGKTFALDLPYGSPDNGTSIGIWTNDESDARKFKFVDNGDGTILSLPRQQRILDASVSMQVPRTPAQMRFSGQVTVRITRNGKQ